MLHLQLNQDTLENMRYTRENKLFTFIVFLFKVLIYGYTIDFLINTSLLNAIPRIGKVFIFVFICFPLLICVLRDCVYYIIPFFFDIMPELKKLTVEEALIMLSDNDGVLYGWFWDNYNEHKKVKGKLYNIDTKRGRFYMVGSKNTFTFENFAVEA